MKGAEIKRIAGRLVMMIGGEAMQSAFNFALNLALLHVLSAKEYGVFALVLVIGGLGLSYIRSLTAMPASVYIAQSHNRGTADAYEVTFGTSALMLSAIIMVAVAILLDFWGEAGALAGAAFVGLWSIRSHLRTVFFARGRQKIVSISDIAFTLAGAALAALVLANGTSILKNILLVLAVANALGIAVMLGLARRPVRISFRASMRRRYVRIWRQLSWSVVSVTTTNIQGQGIALLVAGIAGPAAYAPIAAALVLFVPLRVAATALANMVHPEMSALLARGETAKVWQMAKVWSALLGLVGLVYGAIIMLMLPLIPSQALKDTPIHLIGFFAWAIYTFTMLYVMPRIILEILAAFSTIALITTISAVVGMSLIVLILMVAQPAWSLFGGAVSELIVLIVSWAVVWRRQRTSFEGAQLGRSHRRVADGPAFPRPPGPTPEAASK